MITKFMLSVVVGGAFGGLPVKPVEIGSIPATPLAPVDCTGCGYSDLPISCANCTFSIVWGGGNSPGTCKQVNPCGPTLTPCKFGAFTVTISAASPGCELQWWDFVNSVWGPKFRLSQGQVSMDVGDAANPVSKNCGTVMDVVKCGSSIGGVQCTYCL